MLTDGGTTNRESEYKAAACGSGSAFEHSVACIVAGDGANDLSMMAAAGLGVAFHAKPAVRAASPIEVTHRG